MSVLEIAWFRCSDKDLPARRAGFERAVALLRTAPGVHEVQVFDCIENPQEIVLQARWDAVQNHVEFRESDLFQQYRSHISGYFIEPPVALHYEPSAGGGLLPSLSASESRSST